MLKVTQGAEMLATDPASKVSKVTLTREGALSSCKRVGRLELALVTVPRSWVHFSVHGAEMLPRKDCFPLADTVCVLASRACVCFMCAGCETNYTPYQMSVFVTFSSRSQCQCDSLHQRLSTVFCPLKGDTDTLMIHDL